MPKKPAKDTTEVPVEAPAVAPVETSTVDPTTLEPKPVAPPPESNRMVDVVYMPGPEGPDDTSVAGVAFHAYEPVSVNVERMDLVKLHQNPWFGPKVDADRQGVWQHHREKQAAARKAKEEADQLL